MKQKTLSEIVADYVEEDLKLGATDLYNLAKNAEIKINSLRRLLNERTATTKTIEALLRFYKTEPIAVCNELGFFSTVKAMLEEDKTLNEDERQFIYEHTASTVNFIKSRNFFAKRSVK